MFNFHMRFLPTFDVKNYLSPEELSCYQSRAQAWKHRFPWSDTLLPVWNNYLVHLSPHVPGKIEYYASIAAMMENRRTRTSPEMFFERMLGTAPPEIKAAWQVEVMGQILPELQIIPNTDPDGWVKVYRYGPSSCMAGSDAVAQYAHPDNNLALAYLTDSKRKDRYVSHRTIINTARKTYVRMYGDDPKMFAAVLARAGYKPSGDTLDEEVIYIRWDKCPECGYATPRGPYLDGSADCVQEVSAKEGLISGRGETVCHTDEYNCGCLENSDDESDDEETY